MFSHTKLSCLLIILMSVFSSSLRAEEVYVHQPAHLASPEQYSLLLENESVLVLKMVLEPGEADMTHSHSNETVYFEKGGQLTITENGIPFVVDVPDGHVMWHSAWSHQVTNTGDTTVTAIIVEEKRY